MLLVGQLRAHGGESHRREEAGGKQSPSATPNAQPGPPGDGTTPAAAVPGPSPQADAPKPVISPDLLLGIAVLLGWIWLPWLRRLRQR